MNDGDDIFVTSLMHKIIPVKPNFQQDLNRHYHVYLAFTNTL